MPADRVDVGDHAPVAVVRVGAAVSQAVGDPVVHRERLVGVRLRRGCGQPGQPDGQGEGQEQGSCPAPYPPQRTLSCLP